jgi:hypothetical protein
MIASEGKANIPGPETVPFPQFSEDKIADGEGCLLGRHQSSILGFAGSGLRGLWGTRWATCAL